MLIALYAAMCVCMGVEQRCVLIHCRNVILAREFQVRCRTHSRCWKGGYNKKTHNEQYACVFVSVCMEGEEDCAVRKWVAEHCRIVYANHIQILNPLTVHRLQCMTQQNYDNIKACTSALCVCILIAYTISCCTLERRQKRQRLRRLRWPRRRDDTFSYA